MADNDGNFSPATDLPSRHITQYVHRELLIEYLGDQVVITKTAYSKYCKIQLLNKGVVIATQPLHLHTPTVFVLSDKFYLCADTKVTAGHRIHSIHLNASLTPFRISGIQKLNIVMRGGQPGPTSTPLHFLFHPRQN
ncbi:hypothetical protein KDD30_20580 (plasmid) [Photobacterium sp. GJ3]|uniref:hypothetical protein n=1 Tax=Photobacterium sp. GJ3 TaxID=2829502 RepID=UPI001B8B8D09|nr:hypothetical protein [Photobacterium sp. GJ3]QUJ70491.1 hypothetical protein KDD30_20580 [Photobacterium sp. GJ3]